MKELQLFDIYQTFIDDMNKSSSVNEKVGVLKNCKQEVHDLLYYTYNPFFQYHISPKVLEKRKDLNSTNYNVQNIFQLLDLLRNREVTGHSAIAEVNNWLTKNDNLKDIFYLILERNLKIRASIKLINRAIPGLIPTFSVALAEKFDESVLDKKKIDFVNDDWYISRKLDGVRCLVFVDEFGETEVRSRSGKKISTLYNLEQLVKDTGVTSAVFDGEICKVGEEDNENFQDIMKEINRKNHQITEFTYFIFDLLTSDEFYEGSSIRTLSTRFKQLKDVVRKSKKFRYLPQGLIKSEDHFHMIQTKVPDSWEGLMLRKDAPYKGKRSKDIYKIKKFFDAEYQVIDIATGPFRYVKEGVEVEEDMLSAVIVEHKGNRVNVGSGFTIDQRKHFYDYPANIIDKTITVQYFEESQSQNGDYSLRFPVVKHVHGEKRVF
jgi:DNA ligase-1